MTSNDRSEGWRDETVRDLLISASHVVSATETCACPDEGHQNSMHDLAADVVRVLSQDADGGKANDCPHYSATGIDTTAVGPGKVWRCDHCGLTWRDGGDGQRAVALAPTDAEARLAAARSALAACREVRDKRAEEGWEASR